MYRATRSTLPGFCRLDKGVRYRIQGHSADNSKVIVQSKYNTEKLIAVQGNSSFKGFQAKWKLFIKRVISQHNECYRSLKHEVMYMLELCQQTYQGGVT